MGNPANRPEHFGANRCQQLRFVRDADAVGAVLRSATDDITWIDTAPRSTPDGSRALAGVRQSILDAATPA